MIFLNIVINELSENNFEQYNIEEFLFKMIKECYNLDYVPEYHKDINQTYCVEKCSNISHRGVQCGVWCESAVMRLLRGDGVELSVDAADDGLWSG